MLVSLPGAATEPEDAQALLAKALDEQDRARAGDDSAAQRYLLAILEIDPEHLEALWQLLKLSLSSFDNTELLDRAGLLAQYGPAFDEIRKVAEKKGQQAFLHYVNAIEANLYNASGRALQEIDKALEREPQSVRYVLRKGKLLSERGVWEGNDQDLEQGISWIQRAQALADRQPSPFVNPAYYDFEIAWAYAHMRSPRREKVVEHYLKAIEIYEREGNTQGRLYGFAWNNVSIAYRKLGECTKAREAAVKALTVMSFGAAKMNKRYADFCLEMMNMGIINPDGSIAEQR